jgi:hypothetical protein
MKRTIALLLLLMPCWAWACLPFNQPGESTSARKVTTAAGEAYGWWCRLGTNLATGQDVWGPTTV